MLSLSDTKLLDDLNISSQFRNHIFLRLLNSFEDDYQNIQCLESNGSSIVLYKEDSYFVLQYYLNKRICEKISNMFLLDDKPLISYIVSNSFILSIHLFDHIPKLYGIIDTNTIKWEKIQPLHLMYKNISISKDIENFLAINWLKFLFDIGKALYGLHKYGYTHGDPSIDNIGINMKGNFVLFDYDSANDKASLECMNLDYYKLSRSIKIYVSESSLLEKLLSMISFNDKMISELIDFVKETFTLTSDIDVNKFIDSQVIVNTNPAY